MSIEPQENCDSMFSSQQGVVLNLGPVRNLPEEKPSASIVSTNMRRLLLRLKAEFMSPNGNSVNYFAMKSSPLFSEYLEVVKLLRDIQISSWEDNDRKAFFLNIYNCLTIHALVEDLLSENDSFLKRLQLYDIASYEIGHHIYTLNDIEHGILRGNRNQPTFFSRPPFVRGDPRLECVVELDPRIHFALNCGARSCPPIAVFSPLKLESQLQIVTTNFLEGIEVDISNRKIFVSKLFQWYRNDFGRNDMDIILWIKQHSSPEISQQILLLLETCPSSSSFSFLSRPSIRLEYFPYDWRINFL